jgi:predicted O-methyltransferase YrrM
MNLTNIKKNQLDLALSEHYAYPIDEKIMARITDEIGSKVPSLILEIGTGYGISTALFLEAFKDAKIYTYEKSTPRYEKALSYFKALNIDAKIEMFNEDAKTAEFPKNIDVALIDASKASHHLFLEKILTNLNKDGVIFIDNMHISRIKTEPSTRSRRALLRKHNDFLAFLETKKNLIYTIEDIHDGLAIIRFK